MVTSALPFQNLITRNNIGCSRCSSSRRDGITFPEVIDYDHLERKYGRCGVKFTGIGDDCVLKMELDNGSSAKLMLPSGLITSYKAQMWHGGTMELLHTSVEKDGATDAAAVIRGGLSLALTCGINGAGAGAAWYPNAWSLHQVTGTPEESIQVELMSASEEGEVGIKHIITLEKDSFNSEIVVSNSSTTSSVYLLGTILCHLGVSTPEATYALGLEASDYFVRPPFQGKYSIIPPNFATTTQQNPNKFWPFNALFPTPTTSNVEPEDDTSIVEESGEEDDNYKHLMQKLSRIYTSAPRSLTIMDRGRRNSVTVTREGFNEVYILSPGAEHEIYSKYSYVCIGHAAQLQPLIVDAQSEWSGSLQLFNPNY